MVLSNEAFNYNYFVFCFFFVYQFGSWCFCTYLIYLYARWLRLGSMSASNSINSLRNLDGNLSQLCVSLEQALFDKPITTAKNAFKFWYSLQLRKHKNKHEYSLIRAKEYIFIFQWKGFLSQKTSFLFIIQFSMSVLDMRKTIHRIHSK